MFHILQEVDADRKVSKEHTSTLHEWISIHGLG